MSLQSNDVSTLAQRPSWASILPTGLYLSDSLPLSPVCQSPCPPNRLSFENKERFPYGVLDSFLLRTLPSLTLLMFQGDPNMQDFFRPFSTLALLSPPSHRASSRGQPEEPLAPLHVVLCAFMILGTVLLSCLSKRPKGIFRVVAPPSPLSTLFLSQSREGPSPTRLGVFGLPTPYPIDSPLPRLTIRVRTGDEQDAGVASLSFAHPPRRPSLPSLCSFQALEVYDVVDFPFDLASFPPLVGFDCFRPHSCCCKELVEVGLYLVS